MASLDPSPGDTPVTASQRRSLATLSTALRYTKVIGSQNLRAGVDAQRFPVRERYARHTIPSFKTIAATFNRRSSHTI